MLECSPPARRRRVAGEVGNSAESLLSEGASAEAAWPRALPRGWRAFGHGHGLRVSRRVLLGGG